MEKVDRGFVSPNGELVGYQRQDDVLYELKENNVFKYRTEVGMVFQGFNPFPHLTVLENVIEALVALRKLSRAEVVDRACGLLARLG